ncbi:MAG: radical SAM protein [Planctomycetes bacterium]|nr:radical SAM protein [Planctomycetota bacterium]
MTVGDSHSTESVESNNRQALIRHLAANISSLYAPALYEVSYTHTTCHPERSEGSHNEMNRDSSVVSLPQNDTIEGVTIKALKPKYKDVPSVITKAVVADLDKAYYPVKPIIPFAEAVHDRITIEIMRGCPHDCRFCVSSVIKSPLRYRSLETCLKLAEDIYRNTGYDEISLLSLSSGDYPHLDELIYRLTARFKSRKVGISLPSMRVDSKLRQIPGATNVVRKSGFTLAPEAGTERLRKVISKNITDDDFFAAVRAAYEQGWRIIKLYFMIGLPTETDADIEAIINMVRRTSELRREVGRLARRSPGGTQAGNVNVTISPFVPKPHTRFQWAPMLPAGEISRKQEILRKGLRIKQVQLKFHDPRRSYIESVFARGDRRLGEVLLKAWQAGCKFDAWDEVFDHSKWQSVFAQLRSDIPTQSVGTQAGRSSGFDPDFYALWGRTENEVLPWSHINCGIAQNQLLKDWTETNILIS